MTDARTLSQQDLEILVARELRKAGLRLPMLSVRRRTRLEPEVGRYELVLEGTLERDDTTLRLLIHCHNRDAPVDEPQLTALDAHLADSGLDGAMMVSTSGYTAAAVTAAARAGVPLLAIADGATAWRSSGWASSQRPPAWFPEFTAQVIARSEIGEPRARLVVADQPGLILDQLRPVDRR